MKKFTSGFVLAVALGVGSLGWGQVQTLQVRINSGNDDVEENETNNPGDMYFTSSDIELVNDGSRGNQTVGLRFNNLTIPQGAVITNAYVQFTVDEDDYQAGTIVIKAEDVNNSPAFANVPFNVSSRSTTADSVLWQNIPVWNVIGAAGTDQQTPDISALVQAVVNRSGWASGNSLSLIITGNGEHTAESYDGSGANAPLLVVEYVTPQTLTFDLLSDDDDAEEDLGNGAMDLGSSDLELTTDGSSNQVIGLRYDNVGIPAGSTILNAYLQFTVDEVNTTGQVDVIIGAEAADDAPAITNTTGNLSNRNYTFGDTIIWQPGTFAAIDDAGAAQRTSDIASVIREVIGRPGWKKNNAILIGMADPAVLSYPGYSGNTGKRVAQSRDKSSSKSAKLIITYVAPAEYQNGAFPVEKGASWKFSDEGTDLSGTNWTALNYSDSAWQYGDAILGYGDGTETSTLDFGGNPSNKRTTYYLRHIFEVDDASLYDSLVFDVLRDDGVVVYVNGVEAFRQNMPSGTVGYSTLASSAVGGSDETAYFRTKTGNLLQTGLNVIAVELHQASASSSDLGFDMAVGFELPPLQPAEFPLAKGSDWHYLDNGSCLDTIAWKDTLFNDDNWNFGPAPLGYGDAMNTTISYGPDANNKYITYYFRRDVNLNTADLTDTVYFSLRKDDGAVVYVNGMEVVRDNMPVGSFNCNTTAPNIISGGDETSYSVFRIPKTVFVNGRNQIAVEVHNRDVFSSDLGFDLAIENAPVVNPPANCGIKHIGCFTSVVPTSQTPELIIPKEHKFQLIFKQGEAYTKSLPGWSVVPGNHDFTAYVPKNGSSELGHLAINHETTPGAVSVLDLHFDSSTKLWVVDTTQPVNFYTNSLVTTSRNCSGGITPWGTVITAEETTSSGDANGDGYQDVGWLVELDPETGKVIDYDGDGNADKLWGMGRMSHENIVVADDSVTCYYGEDGGTHCVYKFVADTPGDLSSGKVYVLSLDQPLIGDEPTGTTGTWILVPNTTQADCNNLRTLASAVGGTNFNGVEDCEISPVDGKVYFTAKGRNRTFRFTDNGSTVADFETFVGGMSYDIATDQGTYSEPWGSGNDNLTFDNQGNLWVLQDGGRNYIWLVRPDHSQIDPKVELFASFPAGSEPTGLTFSPDYRFGFVSVQHPSSGNDPQEDASGNMVVFDKSATFVFALAEDLGTEAIDSVTVVSDSGWSRSTVVTTASAYNFPWTGVSSLPADSTFTLPVVTGQPYSWFSIQNVEGAEVISAESYVTYYKTTFQLNDTTGFKGRFRTHVDDNAEIYVNGKLVARNTRIGRQNYKNAPFDLLISESGVPANGFNGGDAYEYVAPVSLEDILVSGENTVILAVRNRALPDLGGFSFRMDLEKPAAVPVAAKSAVAGVASGEFRVYPNPARDVVHVNVPVRDTFTHISIYDVNGRLLHSEKTTADVQLDISSYPAGVYFFTIQNGEQRFTEKLVKDAK